MEYIIRDKIKEDESYIYNSYLKSYYKNYPIKLVPQTLYFRGQAKVMDFLLENANVQVFVFPEDTNEIIGYIIYQYVADALVIHYIFIREMFQGQKIATEIIKSLTYKDTFLIIATHLTDNFKHLRNVSETRLIYDPFLLMKLMGLNY
jgi:hypothetical protein